MTHLIKQFKDFLMPSSGGDHTIIVKADMCSINDRGPKNAYRNDDKKYIRHYIFKSNYAYKTVTTDKIPANY